MKRAVIGLITVLSMALGTAVAQAHDHGPGGAGQPTTAINVVAVAGTVVSVDPTTSSFVAQAFVPAGEGGGWGSGDGVESGYGGAHGGPGQVHGDWAGGASATPATTQVTITTGPSTTFRVDGQTASLSQITAGQHFVALFTGGASDTLQTLVSSPAVDDLAQQFLADDPGPRNSAMAHGRARPNAASAFAELRQRSAFALRRRVPFSDSFRTSGWWRARVCSRVRSRCRDGPLARSRARA